VLCLQLAGVALWDSLQACVRPGSLDARITNEIANDFPADAQANPEADAHENDRERKWNTPAPSNELIARPSAHRQDRKIR
jgi:hypothetical protein